MGFLRLIKISRRRETAIIKYNSQMRTHCSVFHQFVVRHSMFTSQPVNAIRALLDGYGDGALTTKQSYYANDTRIKS